MTNYRAVWTVVFDAEDESDAYSRHADLLDETMDMECEIFVDSEPMEGDR